MNAHKTEVIKWWDVLDAFAGLVLPRDIARVLRMARDCQHHDAKWLCSLFPGDAPLTKEEVSEVMAELGNDPRALFIRSQVSNDPVFLDDAAVLGYAPAQARWADWNSYEKLTWAEKAAAQGDRLGLFQVGCCLFYGCGCELDRSRGVTLVLEAAHLGERRAQFHLGVNEFTWSDWQRYHWWGKAATRKHEVATASLTSAAVEQLKCWDDGICSGRVLFELGSALKEHVDVASQTCFEKSANDEELTAMCRCAKLYDEWCNEAKAAIACWIVIGRRLSVVKDVRQVIARMLWKERATWSIARKKCLLQLTRAGDPSQTSKNGNRANGGHPRR